MAYGKGPTTQAKWYMDPVKTRDEGMDGWMKGYIYTQAHFAWPLKYEITHWNSSNIVYRAWRNNITLHVHQWIENLLQCKHIARRTL